MILNLYEDKKIDVNLPSNEYFPKSVVTKPKNDQGKSYIGWTDRQTDRQRDKETDIENYNIPGGTKYLPPLLWPKPENIKNLF